MVVAVDQQEVEVAVTRIVPSASRVESVLGSRCRAFRTPAALEEHRLQRELGEFDGVVEVTVSLEERADYGTFVLPLPRVHELTAEERAQHGLAADEEESPESKLARRRLAACERVQTQLAIESGLPAMACVA